MNDDINTSEDIKNHNEATTERMNPAELVRILQSSSGSEKNGGVAKLYRQVKAVTAQECAEHVTSLRKLIKECPEAFGLLYNTSRDDYWHKIDEEWSSLGDRRVHHFLKVNFGVGEEKCGSEAGLMLAEVLDAVVHKCFVRTVVNIAGYPAGRQLDTEGRPWLVPTATTMVEPADVDWTVLRTFLEELLPSGQLDYFYSWLKWDDYNVQQGLLAPGQLLVLVGPPGCGKTMLQERVISPLLGGSPVDCLRYMTGGTEFNSQLYPSRHWIMSDGTTFGREKVHFVENIKRNLVNKVHSLHKKTREEITVWFCPRLSQSSNESNMQSIADLEDMGDKMLVFLVNKPTMLPSANYSQAQFEADINAGLPGLKNYIRNYTIPPAIAEQGAQRFGVQAYVHPKLELVIGEAPELREMREILQEWYRSIGPATARMIYFDHLMESNQREAVRELCRNSFKAFSMMLSKLAQRCEKQSPPLVRKLINTTHTSSDQYVITPAPTEM